MLENRMVIGEYYPETMPVEAPDGLTVIRGIQNSVANDLIADEVNESAGNGKTHLQTIFDLAYQGQEHAAWLAIIKCATEAGNSQYAREVWHKENDWVNGE